MILLADIFQVKNFSILKLLLLLLFLNILLNRFLNELDYLNLKTTKVNSSNSCSTLENTEDMLLMTNSKSNLQKNESILRLKQEMDHLILQLQYERHLREKYEESSNRLYSFKIERDQLQIEKSKLELNLKQLVEKYKLEIEESLSMQNKTEVESYRLELDEKNKIIE